MPINGNDFDMWRNRALKALARFKEDGLGIGPVRPLVYQLLPLIESGESHRIQPKDLDRFVALTLELEERIEALSAHKAEEEQLKAERERKRQQFRVLFAEGRRVPLREITSEAMDARLRQERFPADVLFSALSSIHSCFSVNDLGDLDWELRRTNHGWEGTVCVVSMDEYSIWPRVWSYGSLLVDALQAAITKDEERLPGFIAELSDANHLLAGHVTLIAERLDQADMERLDPLERVRNLDMLRDAIDEIDALMGDIFSAPDLLASWLEIPTTFAEFRQHVLQSEARATAYLPEMRSWLSELAEQAARGKELSTVELSDVHRKLGPAWEYRLRYLPWMIQIAAKSGQCKDNSASFVLIRTLEKHYRVLGALTGFFGTPLPRWLDDHVRITRSALNEAVRRDCLG